jgi:hypothetical protein
MPAFVCGKPAKPGSTVYLRGRRSEGEKCAYLDLDWPFRVLFTRVYRFSTRCGTLDSEGMAYGNTVRECKTILKDRRRETGELIHGSLRKSGTRDI